VAITVAFTTLDALSLTAFLRFFTTVIVFMILLFAVSFAIKVLQRIYPCFVMITKQPINDEIFLFVQ
jgi:hypothetical protein